MVSTIMKFSRFEVSARCGFDVDLHESHLARGSIGGEAPLMVAFRTAESLRHAPGEAEPAVAEALEHWFAVAAA